jgi:hypothetical protein
MLRLKMRGAAALLLGLGLAACGDSGTGPTGGTGTAQMRLMNAAVGAPALDLLIGGKLVAGGVQFESSSALASVPGGSQTLVIRRTGETATLSTKQVNITDGAKYSVVAAGTLAAISLTPALVPDTGVAKPDRANIRFINIGVDVPTDSANIPPAVLLDVYVTAPGADLNAASPRFSQDARYSSYSSILYFDPGTWVVRYTTAGTKTVVATSVSIPIAAGEVKAVTLQKAAGGAFTTSVVTEN